MQPGIQVRLNLLERLPITAAPVRVGLGSYDLSGHEPPALAMPGTVVFVSFAVPGVRSMDGNFGWDVDEDPFYP